MLAVPSDRENVGIEETGRPWVAIRWKLAMIDIEKTEERIRGVVAACGARVGRVGASEKSDAIYINIHKPKEVSAEYGVIETYDVLVRVANHDNHTNTHDLLMADLYLNLSDEAATEDIIEQLREFLLGAVCTEVIDTSSPDTTGPTP